MLGKTKRILHILHRNTAQVPFTQMDRRTDFLKKTINEADKRTLANIK